MRHHRRLPAERGVEMRVQRQRVHPFVAAQNVCDLHQMVVDDVGHVIGGDAVGLHQHGVLQNLVLEGDVAADHVVHGDLAIERHLEAHRVRLAARGAALGFGRVKRAAMPVVPRIKTLLLAFFRDLLHALGRAEAAVGEPGFEQLFRVALINFQPLGLHVGAVFAAHFGAFIPIESQIPKSVHQPAEGLRIVALLVGILDA